ncbi:type II secretion system minor pseudopilin GspK [Thermaurantiacus sp.]
MRWSRPRAEGVERGAALLAVIAMVAMLAALASIGLARLKAATDEATDAAQLADAQLLMASATALSLALVNRAKAEAGRDVSALAAPRRLAIGAREVEIRFRPADLCFNLNALGSPGADEAARGLARLLEAAGLATAEAGRIAARTRDAMKPGGLMLADVREWQAIAGLSDEAFRPLAPLLCVLPTRDPPEVNINTLTSRDRPLLVAMGMGEAEAEKVLAARPAAGWGSVSDFWAATGSAGEPDTALGRRTGTASRWIELAVRLTAGGRVLERRLLLDTAVQPARVAASEWRPPRPVEGPA